ncbi:uncharacterized protein LOC125947019 [Dermacentor silvarum]|uniref:uncharacterized protein LOC125947019 n=1 Tax=Dermacentor silvarum TaxID=543639 RepID=UPI002100D9AD|nr:uncharacterized protein LOC125947019 [Dermacentor silvarum]
MASKSLLLIVLAILAEALICGGQLPGGWNSIEPESDPHYRELIQYALAVKPVVVDDAYCALYNINGGEEQVVEGYRYKLMFDIAKSNCIAGRDEYIPVKCTPVLNAVPIQSCTVIFWERSWLHKLEMESFECDALVSDSGRYEESGPLTRQHG